jgi:hypothetical protein
MTSITVLPAQKIPKKLTARTSPYNLHEHFLSFLNTNNATGFVTEEITTFDAEEIVAVTADEISIIDNETIIDLLIYVCQHSNVSERRFKNFAKRLKKSSAGSISHSRALEIVSRVFGYANWHEACKVIKSGTAKFENRRNCSNLKLHRLLVS